MVPRLMLSALVIGLLVLAGCEDKKVQSCGKETPDVCKTPPAQTVPPQATTPVTPDQPKVVAPAPDQPKTTTPVAPDQPKTTTPKTTTPAKPAKPVTLTPTKDVRVFLHPSEAKFNGGTGGRLRTAGIQKSSGELILMDFDRKAIKAFLDANAGLTVTGKLVLCVYEVQGGGGKVEAATLDTASDWAEGDKSQAAAAKGESSAVAAQTDVAKWTTADGKEVADVREVVYDRKADKVKTLLNSKSADVADKAGNGTVVELELDAKFVQHLGASATCKGLVLFNRTPTAKIDFCSRDQNKKAPRLILSAK